MLEKKIGPIWVAGTVMRWEPKGGGHRVTLSNLTIDRMLPKKVPSRVRITVKGANPDVQVTDRFGVLAEIYPPVGRADSILSCRCLAYDSGGGVGDGPISPVSF